MDIEIGLSGYRMIIFNFGKRLFDIFFVKYFVRNYVFVGVFKGGKIYVYFLGIF